MKRLGSKAGAFILAMSLVLFGCANDKSVISATKTINGLPSSSTVQSSQTDGGTVENSTSIPEVNQSQPQSSAPIASSQGSSTQEALKIPQASSTKPPQQPAESSSSKAGSSVSTKASSKSSDAAGEFPIIEIPIPRVETPAQSGQTSSQAAPPAAQNPASTVKRNTSTDTNEVRGVWISYLEFLDMPDDRSEVRRGG